MKKAEQIITEAVEDANANGLEYPDYYALSVLIAKYDKLLFEIEQLKNKILEINL